MADNKVAHHRSRAGQGRAHAVRLSAGGADVIAVDIAGQLPESVPYESPTPDDLAETARLVEANGRRAITAAIDVRDGDKLRAAVGHAVAELGRLDIIVANAGICCPAPWDQITDQAFRDTIDTNVIGTWNTVMAGAHHIIDGGRGGSIILIGFGCRCENAGLHGALHGEQACHHRHGPGLRRRAGPLQHPR